MPALVSTTSEEGYTPRVRSRTLQAVGKNRAMIQRPRIHGGEWLLCVLLLASGCASARQATTVSDGNHAAREEIPRMLEQQAQAWNAGDIDAFMVPYWHSPNLTFSSGGKVTRGWQATLDRYHQRYPTREAMGRLTFSDLEITQPSPTVALVLGRWWLDRSEPIGGSFSLVLRKDDGRWVIVHDHTSTDAP